MKRIASWALPVGLALQLGICGLYTFGVCGSCRTGDWIAALGGLGYAAILVALICGWDWIARTGTAIAFATHAVLAYEMWVTGQACALCITAAAVSVPTFVAACIQEPVNLIRFGVALPVVAVVLLGVFSVTALVEPAPGDQVTLTIYELPDCPFCQRLKAEVLPTLEDLAVPIRYLDARSVTVPMRLPFIIVAKGGAQRVIEGLPPAEYLRAVIHQVKGVRP